MPAVRARLVVVACIWAALCSLPAGMSAGEGEQSAPVFQLTAADGGSSGASLQRLDESGMIALMADKSPSPTWNARQWLTLRRDKTPLPPHPAGKQVVFTNGDCLLLAEGRRLRIVDNRLQFQPESSLQLKGADTVLSPPLPSVAIVWLGGPDGDEEPQLLLRKLLASRLSRDVVLLKDGERVEGRVLAVDSDDGCRVQVGQRRVDLVWHQVAAVAFNSELLYAKTPERRHYHVVLASGSRVGLDKAHLDKGSKQLQGTTLCGTACAIGLTDVIALDACGGPATYLSDLKALKYEHTPFVGTSWPLVRDGSVSGRALRLAGSTFDKGLGMHAESRVSYALARKYRWFEVQVGLDPLEGQGGRVRLRVFVDGRERDLGWNKELTAADGPLVLRLDVSNAREITLEVLFAARGDVQAHVNWADARLVD